MFALQDACDEKLTPAIDRQWIATLLRFNITCGQEEEEEEEAEDVEEARTNNKHDAPDFIWFL